MPVFTDDDPPARIEDGAFDVEADANGVPHAAPSTVTERRADTDPSHRRRFAKRPRAKGTNPQTRVAAAVQTAVAAGAVVEPGKPPPGVTSMAERDLRVWWPRLLQVEFLDKGFTPDNARLTIERTRAPARGAEANKKLDPPIGGDLVAGNEGQSPGEALVEHIIDAYHEEARGPATYRLTCYHLAECRPVGGYGQVDLDAYQEIMTRRRRVQVLRQERYASASRQPFAPAPRGMLPASPASFPEARQWQQPATPVAPAAPPPPPMMPPPPPPQGMSPEQEFFWQIARQLVEERMRPPAPTHDTIPAPPLGTQEERDAKLAATVSKTLVETLVALKIVVPGQTLGAPPAAAPPAAPPRKTMLEEMYDELEQQDKKQKLWERVARSAGFVKPEEVPETETAPAIVEDKNELKKEEGEGEFDFMLRRVFNHIGNDPAAVLKFVGTALNNPVIGGMLKNLAAANGMPLPSIPTTGVPSGGFIPTP